MSSQISLGAFNTTNGKTSGLGFVSGLDSAALIDGIIQPRKDAVTKIEDTIALNVQKVGAVSELSVLLERLKTTSDFLRSPPGVGNEDADFFKHTASSISSSTSTAASTYLAVTSLSGATINSYAVDDITVAKAQILRKDGFTSNTASVVGNASIIDNYQQSLGTVVGTVLNTTTPITFSNDINSASALDGFTTATPATLDLIFTSENEFDAADSITVGATTITFGGTGGNDIDISAATTLDQKIDAIVSRLNAVSSGSEAGYTYSRPSTGVLRLTRDVSGPIATIGGDVDVSADFSAGSDTTQRVGIGKVYQNNGSAGGSVALSNSAVAGSVSNNGVNGVAGAAKATTSVVFSADNEFGNATGTGDSLTIGGTELFFNTSTDVDAGNVLGILSQGTLLQKLTYIANFMNAKTTGDEAGYSYTTNGSDTLIITRDVYGDNATVGTDLALDANFSFDGANQTIQFSTVEGPQNNPAATTLISANVGTDGVNNTAISDAKTSHTTTLSGAITFPDAPVFNAGSQTANTFSPNTVTFKATVGGETYTSVPVELDGGSIGGSGTGYNGLGTRIPSGTVITFVKDSQSDTTDGTKDVTFQLTVGDEATITGGDAGATQTAAEAYQDSFGTFLNTTTTITQNPAVPEFRAGTFTLGGVDITLSEGDSLKTIKAKINAASATSGVSADIVQVSSTSYSLILKSTTTGLVNKIVEFGEPSEPGDPPANTIQFGLDNVAFTQQQAANDASFRVDGLTITRATNVVSDVIDKVTFSLLASTGVDDPTLTVNIDHNTDLIKSGVSDFATAYNELKFFIARQTERDENGNLVETALLGDDDLLRNVLTQIDDKLLAIVSGLSAGAVKSLFDVGVDTTTFPGDGTTPKTTGIFVIDEAKFDSAIASDFEAFRKVFANGFVSDSADLGLFANSNKATLTSFKLDIDTSRSVGNKVRVLDSVTGAFLFNADISGALITGQEGTTLDGLKLIYTGDGTDLISVSNTRGVLSKVYSVLESFLAPDTGLIDLTTKDLADEDKRLQDNIDKENISIEADRQLLISKFTQLEAIISQANSVLSFLEAQRAADTAKQ